VPFFGLEEGDELRDGTGAADGCRGGPVEERPSPAHRRARQARATPARGSAPASAGRAAGGSPTQAPPIPGKISFLWLTNGPTCDDEILGLGLGSWR
jgi:hypothetical protein